MQVTVVDSQANEEGVVERTPLHIIPPAQEGARKDDGGKTRFDLIPGIPLEELARMYAYGARWYGPWNWAKGMAWSRMYAALLRHLWRFWWYRESTDFSSQCHHLIAVVFMAFTLFEYERCQLGDDDRP